MPREFTYRGHKIDQLQQMSMDDFIKMLPSRQRRTLQRGLTDQQKIFLERIRHLRGKPDGEKEVIKTHCRDMVVLPEMVGLTLLIHSGKEFAQVTIKPEMIGHYIGEFASPIRKVVHGTPGIGASRSSMYVPLK